MEAMIVSILLASAPLIFATLGEAITEKAGVINLSLDGSIMLSAMAGFGVGLTTGSVWLGFVAGALVSAFGGNSPSCCWRATRSCSSTSQPAS